MMMPDFVKEYAASIPALKDKVVSLMDPDAVLKLVMGDEYSFGSAAWFHSSKCDEAMKKGLATGGEKGWEAWLTGCVKTTIGEDGPDGRKAIWLKACEALGVPKS
jgi:hypothetical protein